MFSRGLVALSKWEEAASLISMQSILNCELRKDQLLEENNFEDHPILNQSKTLLYIYAPFSLSFNL